jgi:acyl-CoA synthetase (AMP-forming)/AMP-acid ligase II
MVVDGSATKAMHEALPACFPGGAPGELLHEVLDRHAVAHSHETAYTFVDESGAERVLTYGELFCRARAVARSLEDALPANRSCADAQAASQGTPMGVRVALMYPPGLDFVCAFFGCLYAGAVAIPVYPPAPFPPARMQRDLRRMGAIVADAGASLVLTSTALSWTIKGAAQLTSAVAALARLRFLGTDKAHLKHAAPPAGAPHPSRLGAPVRAATVAFLQVRTL